MNGTQGDRLPVTTNSWHGEDSALKWSRRFDVFGVQVSAITYDAAEREILEAAKRNVPAVVSHHDVRALVDASREAHLREVANSFQIIAPDGQPIRWALNLLYGTGLRDPITGTDLMRRLCERAAQEGVSIYLYGSTPDVIASLQAALSEQYPGLRLAGAESPPFRTLSPEEDRDTVQRINQSGAGIVFVALGYPKQDRFAYEHRHSIQAVQICVGAAFDFLSGRKTRAPRWMQRWGLEWSYRLVKEPRRLWRRYLVANTVFLTKFASAAIRRYLPLGRLNS
jgi:exopolysaccharide biosynthesis WecB/TagA/CpsF family protein